MKKQMTTNTFWLQLLFMLVIVSMSSPYARAQQEIPEGVRATAKHKAGNHKINKWVVDGQRKQYVAVLSSGAVVEIALNGKWIRTSASILEKQLPGSVANLLSPYLDRGYVADNLVFVQEANAVEFYTIDLTGDDDDWTLFVSPQGKMIKKESR